MKVELNTEEKETLRRQQAIEILVGDLFFYILEITQSIPEKRGEDITQWGRRFIKGIFLEIENRGKKNEPR